MDMIRKDSVVTKQVSEDQFLHEYLNGSEQDAAALGYSIASEAGGEEAGYEEDGFRDSGFAGDQEYYESDEDIMSDEDDGGFQDYEDWKAENFPLPPLKGSQDRTQESRSKDEALEEWIRSIKQDSIDLGVEESTGTAGLENPQVNGKAREKMQEEVQQAPNAEDGPSGTPAFILGPRPVRQPASIPPVPQTPSVSWPTGQQTLPQFVPSTPQHFPTHVPFRPALPSYSAAGPFTLPRPIQRSLPTRSAQAASLSLPSLRGPRSAQRSAPRVPTQPNPAPAAPTPKTHYAGPSRRLKPKSRLASNLTPRLPNGTIDFEVKTCVDEMKRDGSEFAFNGHHDGNQKCARVLKALYPDKFPDWISESVLANRLQPTWYARNPIPGRKDDLEWKRIVEMRAVDERLRWALRLRIRGTGVR